MAKVKESINVRIDVGDFSVDDVGGAEDVVKQTLWTGAAALKTRGVAKAKLVLTFKASSGEE